MLPKFLLPGALISVIASVGAVDALSMRVAGTPAELPPQGYDSPEYVDSRGCVYWRSGFDGGVVNWVPQVTRAGEVVCGRTPSVAASQAARPMVAARPAMTGKFGSVPIASNSRGAISPRTGFPVPSGYKVAWDDGRLNPQRGLPPGATN